MTNAMTAASHICASKTAGKHAYRVTVLGCGTESVSEMDSHDILVRNLRFWLDRRSLKAAELARRLGISKSTISQWFRDVSSPELKTVGRIAEILEIPVDELFRASPEDRPEAFRQPTDDAERALTVLADKLGFKIRIEPKKKA